MSGLRGHDGSSAAAQADAAPAPRRAASAPAAQGAAFARALQAAQRRNGDSSRDAPSDRAAECDALRCEGNGVVATCTSVVGSVLADQARATTPAAPPPTAGPRAARPLARAAAAARPGSPQEDRVQDSPTTIEWLTPLLPSGRLTLSRAGGGPWTLHCQAADLEALRGAVAQLADRFEQRALGALQVRVA